MKRILILIAIFISISSIFARKQYCFVRGEKIMGIYNFQVDYGNDTLKQIKDSTRNPPANYRHRVRFLNKMAEDGWEMIPFWDNDEHGFYMVREVDSIR